MKHLISYNLQNNFLMGNMKKTRAFFNTGANLLELANKY